MKKRVWVIWFLCLISIIVFVVRNRSRVKSGSPQVSEPNPPATLSSATSAVRSASAVVSNSALTSAAATSGVIAVTGVGSPASTSSVSVASNQLVGSDNKGPDLPPATVLENMRVAIRAYGSMFNGNPVGTNPEITKSLHGDNPKQVNFIPEENGFRINGAGELVDPWGTPLFFHQLSAHEMEIRCAGPDKVLFTGDDLVTK